MEANKESPSKTTLLLKRPSGQGLLEYALLLLLVTMVIITMLRAFGQTVNTQLYETINNAVANAVR